MKAFFYFFVTLQTLFFNGLIFGEDTVTPPPHDPGFSQTLVMILIALVFFYLILWRPEQKRRKAAEELRSQLKKGDRVTAMGIVGTIDNVKENTVIVRMVDGTKIEFLKAAISDVNSPSDEKETESK